MPRLLLIIALLIVFIASGLGLARWWQGQPAPTASNTTTFKVVATFYPLAYMAKQVGGDLVQVTTIIPNGAEPHDFSLKPKDIISITQADVFIYNGAGLDPWAANIPVEDFTQPNVQLIAAASFVSLLQDEAAGEVNPHIWLDPIFMKTIVEQLALAYSAVDPVHALDYAAQAQTVISQLTTLDQTYQQQLAQCDIHTAIVAHDAFPYLAKRYTISLLPMVGLNPNETPSARTLAYLAALAQQNNIHYIFFEEMTSPKLSQVLADEVGAQTLVLSPIEGLTEDEQRAGDDYFSIMQRNLTNLRLALQCH